MRPRRNYGKHYATNVAPTNASYCSLNSLLISNSYTSMQQSEKVVVIEQLSHAVYKLG